MYAQDLFPLHLQSVSDFSFDFEFQSLGDQEAQVARDLAWCMVAVCSFSACAGWCANPLPLTPSRKLTSGQRVACRHFARSAHWLITNQVQPVAFDVVMKELRSPKFDYGGELVSV